MRSRLGEVFCAITVVVASACAGSAPTTAEKTFVAEMAPHHGLGLELVEIASVRADDVRLRRMVFEMSGYHHSDVDHLGHWLDRWRVTPADDFPGLVSGVDIDRLGTLSGPLFDAAWLEAMIDHHEGALTIAGRVLAAEPRPDIADMARATVEVQSREIDEMRSLLDRLTTDD